MLLVSTPGYLFASFLHNGEEIKPKLAYVSLDLFKISVSKLVFLLVPLRTHNGVLPSYIQVLHRFNAQKSRHLFLYKSASFDKKWMDKSSSWVDIDIFINTETYTNLQAIIGAIEQIRFQVPVWL